MQETETAVKGKKSNQGGLKRRFNEIALIARDPILMTALIFSFIFLIVFVFYPIIRTCMRGFVTKDGVFDLTEFARYFDGTIFDGVNQALKDIKWVVQETIGYGRTYRYVLADTLKMGLMTSCFGTFIGFIFAYATVRCNIPGKRFVHLIAMIPTVSPPFAVAIAMIQLFGRTGLVTRNLLNINFTAETNDIYGMDGLVIVQVLTFFTVSYLMLKSMMERLDASMEEAAETLGASRWYLFRTVTLPLLVPGIASSILLLFVESMADLGNPQFIAGRVTVLSSQIYMAVIGEYNYQKAAALSLVLLLPTLVVYLVQRYYINKRSYVSVTGKPTVGKIYEKSKTIRVIFAVLVYLISAFIIIVYLTIIACSLVRRWGVDFTPSLDNWRTLVDRGLESLLDTTFLSLFATPISAVFGMVIAFLIVRKKFSGKEILDFGSNLGGAVPGTIVGMGFILAFNFENRGMIYLLAVIGCMFYVICVSKEWRERIIILVTGVAAGLLCSCLDDGGPIHLLGEGIGLTALYYIIGAILIAVGLFITLQPEYRGSGKFAIWTGVYLLLNNLILYISKPLRISGKRQQIRWLKVTLQQIADYLEVPFSLPTFFMGVCLFFITALVIYQYHGKLKGLLRVILLACSVTMLFTGNKLVMSGTAYVILFAFLVRSIPASVRSGVAALQQIDGSIEEASSILGGDSAYTFRKVTLPLITPALLSGLIFAFTRHMTSLSAIIFLVSAKWRIVTAIIMSGWEQEGISYAAVFSTVIIVVVLIFIALINLLTKKVLKIDTNIDINSSF